MIYSRKKTLIIVLGAAVLMLGWVLVSTHIAAAGPTPTGPVAVSPLQNALVGTLGNLGNAASAAIAILVGLALLQSFLAVILGYVGVLLNNLFYYNTILNPSNITVVQEGWAIARDVANGLFILILLWIAFTIIFNVENLGGKKLIVRVILIALLINFSLAMVSAVFAFSNVLARPFQNIIKDHDVAGLIIARSKLHTIVSQVRDEGVIHDFEKEALKRDLEEQAKRSQESGAGELGGEISRRAGQNSLLAYLGAPKTAEAAIDLRMLAICGLGALSGVGTPGGVVCLGATIAGALLASLGGWFVAGSLIQTGWNAVLNLAVSNIFLILATFAMATAAIVLLARIIAMVFLATLAPIALMLHMIPGGFAQKLWNDWLSSVIKWAFYAPAFYFLFFMSLRVLGELSKGTQFFDEPVPFQGNVFAVMALLVFLGFLYASIIVARKMGITVADSFIGWGKKMGAGALGLAGGVVGGAISRTGSALFRTVAPAGGRIQQTLQKSAGVPWLRTLGGVAAGAYLGRMTAEKKGVEDASSKLASYSKEEKVAALRRAVTAKDTVAAARALGKDINDPTISEDQKNRALRLATQYGMQMDLLKFMPEKATKDLVPGASSETDAIDKVVSRIKPDELPNISEKSLEKEPVQIALRKYLTPEHLKQVARSPRPELLTNIISALNGTGLRRETYNFLESGGGRAIGLYLPPKARMAAAGEEEERITKAGEILERTKKGLQQTRREKLGMEGNIEALENTVSALLSGLAALPEEERGDVKKEIGRLRNIEIVKLRNHLDVLNKRIRALETEHKEAEDVLGGPRTRPTDAAVPPPVGMPEEEEEER
ncbi:MAG: hypothetical protein HYW89_02565 [Candidatus Sungiibacteriota bacterium]|uniref:Uncharacterized protein n=1 Tax=Candidatus Sungiibacteriota bacterium TaxID=2750080 RepID=A0A7T5RIP5_9BACT|nr:MAG: hypothetical protein HYW89_02565 [Candidatus Sungbacteria bacterium]